MQDEDVATNPMSAQPFRYAKRTLDSTDYLDKATHVDQLWSVFDILGLKT